MSNLIYAELEIPLVDPEEEQKELDRQKLLIEGERGVIVVSMSPEAEESYSL